LTALTSHAEDNLDHNLPLMYWYAMEPLAERNLERALALAISAGENIPLLADFMLRRIGSAGDTAAMDALVAGLGKAESSEEQMTFLNAIRSSLVGRRQASAPQQWAKVSGALVRSADPEVVLQATALGVTFGDADSLAQMRLQIVDDSIATNARLVSLNSLLDAGDKGLLPTLGKLLDADVELKEAAIQGLAQYDDESVSAILLAAYAEMTARERRLALGTLCARVHSGKALLAAIEDKRVPGADLTGDLVAQLQFLSDAEVDEMLAKTWGKVSNSAADKLKIIQEMKAIVEGESHHEDVELGRAIFTKTCMKCHQLYGVGYKIGPDLTGSNRANLDYLLSNIVDPSAVMAKEYRPTIVLTDDGRVVNGLIKAEDDRSLTLQTSDALVTIPKDEIDQRRESEKSMMPEDQLKQFSPQQVKSLFAYLQGKQQVPLLADQENASTLFNGKDLSGWSGASGLWSVEDGELVGRTTGLKHNEWLVSDLSVEDFHLSLEVKLVANQGNSGIQFRSQAKAGEVSGYQADIGKGWWGKLYEEHGRALLWDKSGEEHVELGEWNRYEIIARHHHIVTKIN
ncbi:MAG: family 16 glycoside hydrolase, partial [Planctomycetota bacterium]